MKGKGIFKNCKKAIVCTLSIVAAGCIALAGGAAIAKADTKNVESKTAVSPASLWKIANGVTVSENAKLPEWSINGWRAYQADWVAVVDEYLTEADLPASRTHGVKAVSTSETSRLEYKNIINIDGFTKDDTLVEFVPVSSFRVSTADFTGMKIWITDADDENNWVCINMYAVDAQYGGATRIEAETSTGIDAAYRWGTYHDRTYKSNFYEGGRRDFYNAAYSSYYDKLNDGGRNSLYDLLYEPFSVHYDVEDKSIWVSDYVYGQKKCLLDLDDTGYEGYINSNNAFQGFKNNRVKIAFQTYNIVDTAQYIILNVANNPMNGTQIVDTAAPDALEKLPEGGIPTASGGKPFKTFDIEFYDFFDGVVESKIYAKAEGETDFGEPLSDGVFVPNTQGRYTLRYEAVDKAGNLAVKEYPIFAKYALPPIEIALEGGLPELYFTGEAVAIPQAEISGGSGPLSLDISVVRLSDGKTVEHDGKSFVPYVSGEYCVTYTARDYVGNVSILFSP
ncbi:MAG: hypothetical protein IJB97_06630, partial [Clostridia bacterium]|nr:hypothetical protein [Clostridia bacterium]